MKIKIIALLFSALALTSCNLFAGNEKTPENISGDSDVETTHLYSNEWSVDEEKGTHYHKCLDEGFENLRKDEAAHDYSGWLTDTAAGCENEGKRYKICSVCEYKKIEIIECTGHKWGEPIYEWSYDYSKCSATIVCEKNSNHIINETVDTTNIVLEQPTETESGNAKYFATFTNNVFTSQTKTVILDATGSLEKLAFELNEDKKTYSVKAKDNSITGEVIIPEKYNFLPVNAISDYGFSECDLLSQIIVPDNILHIKEWAFYGCDNISSISLGRKTRTIGQYAFRKCNSLTSIVIPDTVTTIGCGAFRRCDSLETIVLPFVGESLNENCFLGYIFGWMNFDFSDEVGYNEYFPASLKTIIISNACKKISECAFERCFFLTEINIPESVLSIERYGFFKCTSLTNVTISQGVKTLGYGAFGYCSSLTTITLPGSITSIGECTFYGSENLSSLYFAGTLQQWNAVQKGSDWKTQTSLEQVVCSDGVAYL